MARYLLLLVAAAVLVAGCVQSLHPIYTEAQLVFKPELVGVFQDERGETTWTFAKEGDAGYVMTVVEPNGLRGELLARLVQLDDHLLLDLAPTGSTLDGKIAGLYAFHLVPAHTFYLVDQIEPELSLRFLKPAWVKKLLEENPEALAHEKLAERDAVIVLTASTAELQEFVRKYAGVAEAWGGPTRMRKVLSPDVPVPAGGEAP